jgi:transposase
MFIRKYETVNKKTGTIYVTHRLVEAYRTEEGLVRQRVIMQLGTLSLPKSEWRKLAIALEAALAGQSTFFDKDSEIASIIEKAMDHHLMIKAKANAKTTRIENQEMVSIDLQSIATTESRSLGPELVSVNEWNRLNFDGILKNSGFDDKELALAKAVIIGRLIEPSSELSTWSWLENRTSLLEMLPYNVENISKNPIYEIADQLILNKETIETELRKQEEFLFPDGVKIFLYDLTNTYFEGSCLENELAERGKCKSKRTDCPIVTLALVVDNFGFPVFSQIYAGNQSEPETLEAIITKLMDNQQNLFRDMKPTIVMDRGIATSDNIELLKQKEFDYILIERRATENDYKADFEGAKETFEKIEKPRKSTYGDENDVYIKKVEHNEDTCRVLCLSEGREKKEMAIDTKKEERFCTDISKLKTSVNKGNVKEISKVFERVGRLKQRYSSIAKYYEINVTQDPLTQKATDVTWTKKPARQDRNVLAGCYVIETTHKALAAKEIWELYMTLTNVEYSFRSLKTDLGLRPVYHQNAERTKGHLFISVLAYHLLINIERRLRESGDTRKWSTIKKELSTHQRTTVVFTDSNNVINHVRVSGKPELKHQEIYKLLNVKDITKRIHKMAGTRL